MSRRWLTVIAARVALAAGLTACAAEPARPPNVLLVLMDDMGWRDVGFMGNDLVETPHLDRLARGGVVFTQAYASAPNCAPTRACLMSGQYTPRHGIYTVVDPRQPPGSPWHKLVGADSAAELPTGKVTIAETLRDRGYATGFFGMWNLGRGRQGPVTPGGQGFGTVVFPETIGFAKDAYFDRDGNYLSDRLADEVITFMEANRDRPFFAYLADHAVHAPFQPPAELLAKYERKAGPDRRDEAALAATVEATDRAVGRLAAALDRLGIAGETLVIFTSDNGGARQHTAPLKGGKGELYEGGIRVPLVIAWPGVVKPGTTSAAPVATVDLYPTLVEATGATPPRDQPLDGASLVPLLRGGPPPDRPWLFWHFPCYVGRAAPASAVREGRYKLVEFFEDGGRAELYDLEADPGEIRDLAAAEPDRAAALTRTLHAWQRETGAAIPRQANAAYDPAARRPGGGGRPPRGKR